ncbi:MAG: aminotransferase class IV [Chlamydiia bacterium]|nr:aminotransferase class IV [Chlamydiia bacterium]
MIYFVNDHFTSEAKLSLLDLGVLRGFGVFEFARTYQGIFFHLDHHIKRFFNSARTIGLYSPYSASEIEKFCYELLEKNSLSECSVKMVLTGGISLNGFEPEGNSTFALIANTLPPPPKPLAIATAYYERYLPECKTLNYLPAILEQQKARANGFDEVLFLDHSGNILEGARENFFAIKHGTLVTPKLGVLPGVTRQFVIDVAQDIMNVEERCMAYAELPDCEEVFFTSTAKEIAPIARIDSMVFSSEQTHSLHRLYKSKVLEELNYSLSSSKP